MGLVKYGILNDLHFPFECKSRYKVALKIFKAAKIEHLYLNGDIGEFLGVSSHPRHPGTTIPFPQEIAYMNKKFDELQQIFGEMPVTLIEGNHSYRFFRYIRDVAPAMWGLIDCPSILKFPERPKWKFVPYGPDQWVKCGGANLWLRHEPLGGGKNHATTTAENAMVDVAYGHTHTYQAASHRKCGPRPHTTKAYSLGWLGDKTKSVFDYRGPKDRWVHGCTVVEADTKTGEYTLEFICLDKLPVMYRGVKFDAR